MPDATHPTAIVAVTGDHGRFAAVRSRAAALGASRSVPVILYDIEAASLFESPLPTNWSAGGAEEQVPDRLDPDDLERAGRASVAAQVRDLRQQGVDAWGWLPQKAGGDELARYAEEQGAEVILVPAELESPGILDRLQGRDVGATGEAGTVPVVVVEADGGAQDHGGARNR